MTRALAVLLMAIALVGGGYLWGGHATDNAWQAKQAKADREQSARYQAEVERADTAVASYLQDHRQQEDRYEDLDAAFRSYRQRFSLAARPRVVQPAAAAAAGAGSPADGPPGGSVELLVLDVPAVSLGAVWMWNSALAGRDVPAGACDAAAAAGGAEAAACSEDAGLTFDDAWANHTINARSCARDRQRLGHLIEFLKDREKKK